MKTTAFSVTGMGCVACSASVEKSVSKLEGVNSVTVNLLAANMQVEYDEKILKEEQIIAAVEDAGFGAKVLEVKKNGIAKLFGSLKKKPEN